jgi:hypothetical protein
MIHVSAVVSTISRTMSPGYARCPADLASQMQAALTDSSVLRRMLCDGAVRLLIVRKTPDTQWVLYLALALSCGAFVIGVWGMSTTGAWHFHAFGTGAFKDVTSGIQSIITTGAVVIGGSFTY